MSSQQRLLKKRKTREEKNRKEKLQRQKVSVAKRQEERSEYLKLERVRKFQRDMGRLNIWSEEMLMKVDENKLSQLEKNAKILRALEEEYATETNRKKELNSDLEEKGLRTLEQKMTALHNQLVEEQKAAFSNEEIKLGVGGSSDCNFKPNKPRKDVAEVEVIRAAPVEDESIKSENS